MTQALVHYRREDGTEETAVMNPDGYGGWVWTAPEDCAAITGISEVGGGGGQGLGEVTGGPGWGGGE